MAEAAAGATSRAAGAVATRTAASRRAETSLMSGNSFGGIEEVEVGERGGGPAEAGILEEPGGELPLAMLGDEGVDPLLRAGVGGSAEGERDRAEPELEQTVSAPRLQVIVPLRRRPRDQL